MVRVVTRPLPVVSGVLTIPPFEAEQQKQMTEQDAPDGGVYPLDEARTSQQVATLNEIARKLRELADFLTILATVPVSPQHPTLE